MKKITQLILFAAFGPCVYGQESFTDSSICAGLSKKQIEAYTYLNKCSNNDRDKIMIPQGDSFIITGVDSCVFESRKHYKYIIRYKNKFHVIDTAFVKTVEPGMVGKFRLVKDKFKAMEYGVFVEHVLNKPHDISEIDQVEKDYLKKSIVTITEQIKLLTDEPALKQYKYSKF